MARDGKTVWMKVIERPRAVKMLLLDYLHGLKPQPKGLAPISQRAIENQAQIAGIAVGRIRPEEIEQACATLNAIGFIVWQAADAKSSATDDHIGLARLTTKGMEVARMWLFLRGLWP